MFLKRILTTSSSSASSSSSSALLGGGRPTFASSFLATTSQTRSFTEGSSTPPPKSSLASTPLSKSALSARQDPSSPLLKSSTAISQSAINVGSTSFPSSISFPSSSDHLEFHSGPMSRQQWGAGPGSPMMYNVTASNPHWQPEWDDEHSTMPRDEFGVPGSIPPEVSNKIRHVYHVPPHFYPVLKKWGVDTPELKPYLDALMNDEMDHQLFEDMFYNFANPLRISRAELPKPFRTSEEIKNEEVVAWESAWLSFREKVRGDMHDQQALRDYLTAFLLSAYISWVWAKGHRQFRRDLKLFYLEAPECKINWVKPRGDL